MRFWKSKSSKQKNRKTSDQTASELGTSDVSRVDDNKSTEYFDDILDNETEYKSLEQRNNKDPSVSNDCDKKDDVDSNKRSSGSGESYSTAWSESVASIETNGCEACVDQFDLFFSSSPHQSSEQDSHYVNSTPLFEAIKRKWWWYVRLALSSGCNCFPFIFVSHKLPLEEQIRTWTSCKHKKTGELLWRQLPIHVALISEAPLTIIKRLVESYPVALSCGDEAGNLPLHVAFQYNAPDDIILFIMSSFPKAINLVNGMGLTPVETVSKTHLDDDSAARVQLFRLFMKHGRSSSKTEEEVKKNRNIAKTKAEVLSSTLQLVEFTNEAEDFEDERRRLKKAAAEEKLQNLINELDTLEQRAKENLENSQ